jgi:anthraniloyl-CoA monooxygenase
MRVTVVGGGPGGLFASILLRARGIADEVTVLERNGPNDTFGFGVVFSDETLDNLAAADPPSVVDVIAACRTWSGIDIVHRGRTHHSTGHGFSAIARLRLLEILAHRATALGVDLRYRTEIDAAADPGDADLVIAADGANSRFRTAGAEVFRPHIEWGAARYAWFGTPHIFESFTFLFEETEHGVFQAHCYPYSADMSTLIVETGEATWRAAGLDTGEEPLPPGANDPQALRFTEDLFAAHLDGAGLVGNNSKWLVFPTISNEQWHAGNLVLVGDAVHTAHFSIGSGTKLAMEDAIALVDAVGAAASVDEALVRYQEERKPVADSLQRAAHTSRTWFEHVDRYVDLEPDQFVFQLLTRSQRITYDNLELRDPELVRRMRGWFRAEQRAEPLPQDPDTPPMFYPFRLRELTLPNRVGVSPMAQYCAAEGVPDEWHLVHLGSRAVGGAGLVMTEMTCVSPEGRITPGCTGLWNDEQQAAWTEITDFVHRHSDAAVGLQLGHAGRKGSTRVPWEAGDAEDVPLDGGNWELLAPSPVPWRSHNQTPIPMTRAHMDAVVEQHVAAAVRGAAAGFDLLELHMAHGYLLSSFLSPLSNLREDEYGGTLEGRMRFPLEVFDAVREVWPDELPISVRISATDWVPGGITGDDAVAIAAAFRDHGCDIIDVSAGQVHPDQHARYGRLWQTPFSDRIRHETGIPTMTVGAVSSVDDVNTILVAGRADICLLARAHLVDPYWTLNAAIDQQYAGHPWPVQYLRGKRARRREQDPTTRIEDA